MQNLPLAIVFGISYGAGLAFAAATAPELPEITASQFGASGAAQSFMSRSAYVWLTGSLGAGMPLLLLGGFCAPPRWFPAAMNLPNRAYWLAPERRAELRARMDRAGLVLATSSALFLAAVQALVLDANRISPPRLANGPFLVTLGTFLAVTLGTALWLARALRAPAGRPAKRE